MHTLVSLPEIELSDDCANVCLRTKEASLPIEKKLLCFKWGRIVLYDSIPMIWISFTIVMIGEILPIKYIVFKSASIHVVVQTDTIYKQHQQGAVISFLWDHNA